MSDMYVVTPIKQQVFLLRLLEFPLPSVVECSITTETTAAVSYWSIFHLDTWRKQTNVYQRTPLNVPWCPGEIMVAYHVSLATWLLVALID